MSSLYNILKDVISETAHIPFDAENHCLVIEEPINIEKKQLQSVAFKLCKGKSINYTFHFAFKLDDSEATFLGKLFKSDLKDIRKAVDAVMICEYDGQKYIFLIELKSNERSGIINKFRSSELFINYFTDYLNVYKNIQLNEFQIISIIFDRKVSKGKPNATHINNYVFYHQGFNKPNGNEADIRNFIR